MAGAEGDAQHHLAELNSRGSTILELFALRALVSPPYLPDPSRGLQSLEVIDLSSLVCGADGGRIRVAGVAVGESAAGVELTALTGAEESSNGENRTWANGTVYRTADDGTLVEIPLAERIDATLERGGTLRCGDIALVVRSGTVERIFLRGPSVAALGLRSEADVTRAFGPAEGLEWNGGWHMHHYPARNLAVGWSTRDGLVEHIAVGPSTWKEPRLGAPELLQELLATFLRLGTTTLTEPDDGSARVRYQRIAALGRALELGSPPQIVSGEFLASRPSHGRQQVLEELARGFESDRHRPDTGGRFAFTKLLHYRWSAERVIRAPDSVLECSIPVLCGVIAAQARIGQQVLALMVEVDRWLCTLMDPAKRSFELRELIARHGWPDVDLHQLEFDEL